LFNFLSSEHALHYYKTFCLDWKDLASRPPVRACA